MEQEKQEYIQIDLLTPLRANFFPDQRAGEEWSDEEYEYGLPLAGEDLLQYEGAIREMVDWMNHNASYPQEEVCDLMRYFYGSDSIKEKVVQAVVTVKEQNGALCGCAQLQVKEFLDETEFAELCDYITGQYSDGWGEGFEQRDIAVEGGHLNVYFYPGEELDFQRQITGEEKKQPEKLKMNLVGQDGNIFAILGRAMKLLKANGQAQEAEEMFQRVKDSGSYHQALFIISEYVETELSKPEQEHKKDKGKRDREER